ncbi:hypothetical protein AB8615_01670 [Litorimonas sp. RW-G-Af-16]|uniref:hypothetical protein n=1 Tax=Litorimonas sp. RW-G-Af-16 TaxID=3241168 RepID=UPI003AACCA0E
MTKPINIGIWLPLGAGAHWRGEGIARTIEFIINGNRKAGDLGTHVQYTFFTSRYLEGEIKSSLRETIGDDVNYINFVTIKTADHRALEIINAVFSLFGLISFRRGDPKPFKLQKLEKINSESKIAKFYRQGKAYKASKFLGLMDVIQVDLPDYEFPKKKRFREKIAALFQTSRTDAEPAQANTRPFETYRFEERIGIKYTMPGVYIFLQIMKFFDKIPVLRYFSRKSRGAYLRLSQSSTNRSMMKLAMHNAEKAGIDVWWVVNPNVYGAEFLPGSRVTNFWDFVVGEYGYYWSKEAVQNIYARIKLVCHASDQIITQSYHNRELKAAPVLNLPTDKVNIVYLSYPDHYPDYVPSFGKTGVRTPESRKEAADIIRHFVSWRQYKNFGDRGKTYHKQGFMMERLQTFEYENKVYAIVSTQDRPYKNLTFIVDAFFDAVNKKGLDAYLFLTSDVDLSDKKSSLTKVLMKQRSMHRIFSLPRVPNNVHAALYHCASLTIHPSFSEGGVGSYPFLEGMIMGCPGLVGVGDYSQEGQRLHPNYDSLMISPYYKKDARNKIVQALSEPEETYRKQKEIFDIQSRWQWQDVATSYLEVFKKAAGRSGELPVLLQDPKKDVFFEFPES